MKRFLFLIVEGGGNVPAQMSIARRLVARGHEVHVPSNVVVTRSAPHTAVLPLAAAVVCHGGHGTVMKALAHALPLVVMPFGRDQKDNGARVEVCGAGVSLPPTASPGRIASAVRRVLEEPAFRAGAQRMAAVIARDVKEDRAVAEMEALADISPTFRAGSGERLR